MTSLSWGQYLETFVGLTNSLGPRYLRFEYLESFVIERIANEFVNEL